MSTPVEILAKGMVSVAAPFAATVPCSCVKVKASAVLVFFTATKWKVDLGASNNQRAMVPGVLLLDELLETMLLEDLLETTLLDELLEPVPPQLAPLKVKAVGICALGLFTINPNCALALAATLPL